MACGHIRWLRDSPVQDTAVLWALSRSACVLIQEGYTVVLDMIHDTVGCRLKPILGVEHTVELAITIYLYFCLLLTIQCPQPVIVFIYFILAQSESSFSSQVNAQPRTWMRNRPSNVHVIPTRWWSCVCCSRAK